MIWFLVAAVLVTAVAAWTDWRTGKIPNWLTLGALGCAPVAWIVFDLSTGVSRNIANGGRLKWIAISVLRTDMRLPVRK